MAWRRPVRLVASGEGDPPPPVSQLDQQTVEFPEFKIVARPDPGMVPASLGLDLPGDHDWYEAANQRRAQSHLARLEASIARGRVRRAERARASFLATVHADRVARARGVARANGLRLQRAGRGPLLDHPVLHHQRRMAWRIYPLEAFHGIELPDRARRVMRTWESEAGVFDRYYLADEAPLLSADATDRLVSLRAARAGTDAARRTGSRLASVAARVAQSLVSAPARGGATATAALVRPDPCLIGVISGDGCDGDWFVLDRWRH